MHETDSLHHKTFLITGGNSGIGLHLAQHLASQGAHLILLGKNATKLQKAQELITSQYGTKPLLCQFNLANAVADDYQYLQESLKGEIDCLDGLIHCAGILDKLTPLEHMPMAQWQQTLQVNLNARFLLTKQCIPLLRKSQQSLLLFILSELSERSGQACWGPYQAADAATKIMAECLQQELSYSSINIQTLTLPAVKTALRHKVFPFEPEAKHITVEQLSTYWEKIPFFSSN